MTPEQEQSPLCPFKMTPLQYLEYLQCTADYKSLSMAMVETAGIMRAWSDYKRNIQPLEFERQKVSLN